MISTPCYRQAKASTQLIKPEKVENEMIGNFTVWRAIKRMRFHVRVHEPLPASLLKGQSH